MGSSRTSFTLNLFLPPKASQRLTAGVFFSSESAEKNRTGWSAPKRVFNSSEVFKPCRCGFKQGVHATPGRSPLTAASRQCSRRPARHVVVHSQFSPTAFLRLKKPSFNQIHNKGRQRGRFFRAKAQKKIAPDGRPKRDFNELHECQYIRMVGQSVSSMNCTNANTSG